MAKNGHTPSPLKKKKIPNLLINTLSQVHEY